MPHMQQLQYYTNVVTTGPTCEAELMLPVDELMLPVVAVVGMAGDDEDAK